MILSISAPTPVRSSDGRWAIYWTETNTAYGNRPNPNGNGYVVDMRECFFRKAEAEKRIHELVPTLR